MLLLALLLCASVPPAAPAPSATPSSGAERIPLFARYAAGHNPPAYTVPVHISARLHVLFFSFPFRRQGTVTFAAPDSLNVSVDSVAAKYTKIFGEMGTPRTWPRLFVLHILDEEPVDGRPGFRLIGTPREDSDIDHVVIRLSDDDAPIHARWFLHDGYQIRSTTHLQQVNDYLVPVREEADITGHGYRISSDMLYGTYTFKPVAAGNR